MKDDHPTALTAAELSARWRMLPRLGPDEGDDLATDIEAARRSLLDLPASALPPLPGWQASAGASRAQA